MYIIFGRFYLDGKCKTSPLVQHGRPTRTPPYTLTVSALDMEFMILSYYSRISSAPGRCRRGTEMAQAASGATQTRARTDSKTIKHHESVAILWEGAVGYVWLIQIPAEAIGGNAHSTSQKSPCRELTLFDGEWRVHRRDCRASASS